MSSPSPQPTVLQQPQLKTMDMMTTQQKNLLENVSGFLQGQIGSALPMYQGKTAPGVTPTIQSLMDYLKTSGGNIGEYKDPYQVMGTDVLSRLTRDQTETYDPERVKALWKSSVYDPAAYEFKNTTLPQTLEPFTQYEAMSSGAAARAAARAGTEFNLGVNQQLATMMEQEKQRIDALNLQKNQQSLTAAGTGLQYPLQTLSTITGATTPVAQMEYGAQNDLLKGNWQAWKEAQPWNNPYLQLIPSILGQRSFENVMIPGMMGYEGGGTPWWKDVLGAGASIGGAALGGYLKNPFAFGGA